MSLRKEVRVFSRYLVIVKEVMSGTKEDRLEKM